MRGRMSISFDEKPLPRYIPYPVNELSKEQAQARLIKLSQSVDALEIERKKGQKELDQVILEFLEVADALDRIMSLVTDDKPDADSLFVDPRLRRSLIATRKLFSIKLKKLDIRLMDLSGLLFDPNIADAVDHEYRDDLPEETVLREVIRGYWSGERVLRRGQVIVSTKSTEEE
jgi:molecular chaperone GrpE (heat shock protein)